MITGPNRDELEAAWWANELEFHLTAGVCCFASFRISMLLCISSQTAANVALAASPSLLLRIRVLSAAIRVRQKRHLSDCRLAELASCGQQEPLAAMFV